MFGGDRGRTADLSTHERREVVSKCRLPKSESDENEGSSDPKPCGKGRFIHSEALWERQVCSCKHDHFHANEKNRTTRRAHAHNHPAEWKLQTLSGSDVGREASASRMLDVSSTARLWFVF